MTRSMGDATRSNLTWALEVMAKEYPSRSDYSVELGWNLMVTRQFDNAEEILQVKVRLKSQEQVKPSNRQTHRKPFVSGSVSEVSQFAECKNSARAVLEIDEEERNGDEGG